MKSFVAFIHLAAILATAALARGQAINVDSVTVGGGDELASDSTIFLNREQCEANAPVTIRMDNLGNANSVNPVLEVWADPAQNCHPLAGRRYENGVSPCTQLAVMDAPPGEVSISLPVQNIVNEIPSYSDPTETDDGDAAVPVSSDGRCNVTGSMTVYFLLLDTPTPTEDLSTAIPQAVGLPTYVTFQLATVMPSPPTNVTAGPGDTQVTVTWEAGAGAIDSGYELYVDTDGCGDDSSLKPGGPVPVEEGSIVRIAAGDGQSQDVNPADLGLGYEDGQSRASVAVVAVEQGSYNRSVLSEVACIERVQHKSAGGCSVRPGTERNPWLLLWLGMLAVVTGRVRNGVRG